MENKKEVEQSQSSSTSSWESICIKKTPRVSLRCYEFWLNN